MVVVATVKQKHPLAKCGECPLAAKPCAPTQKPPQGVKPKAAVVSRSPSYHDGMNGRPFSGPSGKVLDFLLKQNGVTRHDVLVTNVVLCSPEAGKVPPEAIKACAPRLADDLRDIDLVIACGSEAVNELVGRGAIDRYRGQRIVRNNTTYVATNNPALVLRDDSTFPNLRRDFKRAFHPLPSPTYPTIEVIENVESARRFLRSIRDRASIACDIESRGGITHKADLISIQFSTDGVTATVLGERLGIFEDRDFIGNHLRPVLESGSKFIWHGGKFDTKILRHTYGINARVDHDTMLLSYALDERSGSDERMGVHGLEYLLMEEFGWPNYCPPSVEKAKKTGIVEDYDAFYRYAGLDVGGTFQLFGELLPRAEADDVLNPYEYLLLRGNRLLTEIELHGFEYDVGLAADMLEFEVEPELNTLREDMRKQVDNPILLPTSPQQMASYYYDRWGLKHEMQSRPDMKRSVDDSARREIMAGRFTFKGEQERQRTGNMVKTVRASNADERKIWIIDFVKKHDRHSKLQKQAGTYLHGLIKRAEEDENHRIYTQLNLHGTNSGRLSSSRPNLQNITRTKEGLPDIRRLFKASPGRVVVKADFSQAELRCIASFSGDTILTDIYVNGKDLHNETAARFFGENYTPEQRSICKSVNFGVFYRQGADTFQEKHDIPAERAQPYIDWVWSTFTGVKSWEESIEQEIRKRHVCISPFGRKRRFHLLTRENLQGCFREGINFYPQSTASDLTLCSAIKLWNEIDTNRAAIAILVHDDITGDVEEGYVDEYKTICIQIMEASAKEEIGWTLPFKADIGIGPTWGTAK